MHNDACPCPDTDDQPCSSDEHLADQVWATVVHNDPINQMSYVEWVFSSYFGFTRTRAHNLMIAVHVRGRAVVSTGTREAMERDVFAMHEFGLRATIEEAR